MSKGADNRLRGAARGKGQEIVQGLRELAEALKGGEPLEARFTVRTYRISSPPEYRDGDVRRVRDLLGMSQAAFASFLSVDPSTVRSWEQGLRVPSALARRVLFEIENDPDYWRKRLAACLVGPITSGPPATVPTPDRPKGRGRRGGTPSA
jgi:putative transcriptional regulator